VSALHAACSRDRELKIDKSCGSRGNRRGSMIENESE
jgi:hypothetical protein